MMLEDVYVRSMGKVSWQARTVNGKSLGIPAARFG